MKTNSCPEANRSTQRLAQLNRRRFLRGLGACVALPALESLVPQSMLAANPLKPAITPSGAPLRTAFVYFPNGAIPAAWWPTEEGTEIQFQRTLKPLEPNQANLQVLGGLDHLNARAGADGGGDHARANGTFLTGVRLKKSAVELRAGISIDQVIAKQVGSQTRFDSLELTCEAGRKTGACDSGYSCAYQYNLSWSSPTTPMTPEANPRLVFERLFGAGPAEARASNLRRRQQEQRSILDFVLTEARDLHQQLNPHDQDKLDQYLTGVREIETHIERVEKFGDPKNPNVETPAGIPTSYAAHIQIMYDLLVLAFQTDSTRVATLLLAHDGSNRSFAEIGVPEGHHDLSHHQENSDKIQKVAAIDLWYAKQFAAFLQKLRQTQDTDGQSLLHNSMIVYGGGNADGNRHTHTNLPILLAGNGGGTLRPGRFVKHGAKPATNLFLSLADRMGVQGLDRFGDSSGRLTNV